MLCLAMLTTAGLRADFFDNSALHGPPSRTSSVHSLDFQVPVRGSVELTGTLAYDEATYYAFDCTFGGGQLVFVWVADHLVCHTNPPFGNTESSTDGSPEYPLPAKKGERAPVVVHVYSYAEAGPVTSAGTANVTVRWAKLAAPMHAGATPAYSPVPAGNLSPESSANELKRRALQSGLKVGWNLWTYNLLDVARLPQSYALSLALCQLSTQKCLTETKIEDGGTAVRVGPFATDQSYWQLYLSFAGLNTSISVTGGQGALNLLVEPLDCAPAAAIEEQPAGGVNCSDFALVVACGSAPAALASRRRAHSRSRPSASPARSSRPRGRRRAI